MTELKTENLTSDQLITVIDSLLDNMSSRPTLLEVTKAQNILLDQVESGYITLSDASTAIKMLNLMAKTYKKNDVSAFDNLIKL